MSDSKKTPQDPIDQDTLMLLERLSAAASEAAMRATDLELERVRTLRQYSQIEAERQKTFEKILVDRGMAPSTPVAIDPKTGAISVIGGPTEEASKG
jgi:hypothetical protein